MAYKTILIKAHPEPVLEEYKADAALTPGHLLEINSTNEVKKHATSGGKCYALIALENSQQGKSITDDYVLGEQVYCAWLRTGDEFFGILANGENVGQGDYLESNGDGTFKKLVADTSALSIKVGSLKFMANEAVDMSGSTGADPSGRIRVKVIS